jgi:hypothetical protein
MSRKYLPFIGQSRYLFFSKISSAPQQSLKQAQSFITAATQRGLAVQTNALLDRLGRRRLHPTLKGFLKRVWINPLQHIVKESRQYAFGQRQKLTQSNLFLLGECFHAHPVLNTI